MSDLDRKVLKSLLDKPLSIEDLVVAMAPFAEHQVKEALYQLSKEYLVTMQAAFEGCRNCSCEVKYFWRLTFKGRQTITSIVTE